MKWVGIIFKSIIGKREIVASKLIKFTWFLVWVKKFKMSSKKEQWEYKKGTLSIDTILSNLIFDNSNNSLP